MAPTAPHSELLRCRFFAAQGELTVRTIRYYRRIDCRRNPRPVGPDKLLMTNVDWIEPGVALHDKLSHRAVLW